jgi:3-hydroxyacyl-[acyl-carrier-protein] dehydratase
MAHRSRRPREDDIAVESIEQLIPQRAPFLLVDRILSFDSVARLIVAEKRVLPDEPYFAGHYPQRPLMPGVLQLEALIQTMTAALSLEGRLGAGIALLVGLEGCRFTSPVRPGDVLTLEVSIDRYVGGAARGHGEIRRGDDRVAEATMTLVVEA